MRIHVDTTLPRLTIVTCCLLSKRLDAMDLISRDTRLVVRRARLVDRGVGVDSRLMIRSYSGTENAMRKVSTFTVCSRVMCEMFAMLSDLSRSSGKECT